MECTHYAMGNESWSKRLKNTLHRWVHFSLAPSRGPRRRHSLHVRQVVSKNRLRNISAYDDRFTAKTSVLQQRRAAAATREGTGREAVRTEPARVPGLRE